MFNERIVVLMLCSSDYREPEIKGVEYIYCSSYSNNFCVPFELSVFDPDDCKKLISEKFSDVDIMFIIPDIYNCFLASMIAKEAKAAGILTLGFLDIFPCYKCEGIQKLKNFYDAIFIGSNANEIINRISSLITKNGYVNLDFQDIKTVLRGSGIAGYSAGYFGGYNRTRNAAVQAISGVRGKPKRVLVNITSGSEITLTEMSDAVKAIQDTADSEAQVIWGHVIDESLSDAVRVSIICS